jgi:hypothetical protein
MRAALAVLLMTVVLLSGCDLLVPCPAYTQYDPQRDRCYDIDEGKDRLR